MSQKQSLKTNLEQKRIDLKYQALYLTYLCKINLVLPDYVIY